jgi:hypothetical protein
MKPTKLKKVGIVSSLAAMTAGVAVTVFSLTAITAGVTMSAHADGFLSSIFGKSKGGAGFSELIANVPADTSYIFANKNSIPDEVMKFHLSRGQQMMDMFADIKKVKKDSDKTDAKDAGAFFGALFKDLGSKLDEKKFDETGLSLKASSVIYGYEMMPVFRLGFSDKEKIMATLKRAEEASGYKIELSKCGEFDCFIDPDKTGNKSAAIVILGDHIAASAFSADKKEKMIDHLTGKVKVENPYGIKSWDTFLEKNKYSGYGDGYVNLKKIYKKNSPLIAMGMMGKIDSKELEGCMAVAEEHVNNMPEIVFGTKALAEKNMDYEILFKTSSDVSSVLQTIANKTNIAKRSENAIFDFGININFPKLRDALTQYSSFLIKSGKTNNCSAIQAAKIRKSMGGMAMVMNMGLSQFKSIYASISDVKMGDNNKPEEVEAMVSIGTDDPGGLIAMVGMMSPGLMGFKVPEDGSSVELPKGVIPSKGVPLPPVFLSRSDKSLNIMVGNKKPAMKDYSSKTPEIMIFALDGKRYYEQLTSVIKTIPKAKVKDGKDAEAMKLIESMGRMAGFMTQEVFADDRGLVVTYHVKYD